MWRNKRIQRILGLILLACLALGLRVAVVVALHSEHAGPVAYEHGRIAENLLEGKGFSITFLGAEGPTSQQAPFYPVLLAGVYACLGVGTTAAHLAVQLLQCIAGTGLVLALVWLAWSLVPGRPALGWIAGLGAAVYPTHLYMVTHLQVALWAALVLTTLLAIVVSPRWQGRWSGAILAGSLSGLLLLVEPILALALPVVAMAYWMAESRRLGRPALARVAVMAGVAVLLISPWLVRNRLVHGEVVFIKSSFGYAFWQGNNPSSWGTDKIPKPSAEVIRREHDGSLVGIDQAMWEARHETNYIDDVLLGPDDYAQLAKLSEPERSRVLGRRAWDYVAAQPTEYVGRCFQRLYYFLVFDETNPKAANRVYRAATIVWLVLAFVGLLVSRGLWRSLWPTYLIFGLITLFHALVITSVRFRIPLEPMTFLWAAAAMEPLLARWTHGRRIRVHRPGQCPHDPLSPEPILPLHPFHPEDQPPRRRVG